MLPRKDRLNMHILPRIRGFLAVFFPRHFGGERRKTIEGP